MPPGSTIELDGQDIGSRVNNYPVNTGPHRLRAWGDDHIDKETAIEILNAVVPFNIQHCEEPIPRWNFMELSEVKDKSPVPIMADETCCDHHDAKRLIDLKACDLFNIKLGKHKHSPNYRFNLKHSQTDLQPTEA